MPTAKKRIYLIDDHPVCRHGMAQVINSEADFVCGETGSATQAFAGLRAARSDLVLLDVSERGPDGADPRRLRERGFSPSAAHAARRRAIT